MIRYLIALLLLCLSSCQECYAGFTIYAAPQVPQWVTVHGVDGPEQKLNREPAPPAGYGAEICRPADYAPYAVEEAKRIRVYEDPAGTATDTQILVACPDLKMQIISQIKDIRATALEKATKNSGVYAVYDENYQAAIAYDAGDGDITLMRGGQTATQYLAGFGARLGMTAAQFAAYIINENKKVGPTQYHIEDEYLRLTYGVIPAETSVARLLSYPNGYRGFCGL